MDVKILIFSGRRPTRDAQCKCTGHVYIRENGSNWILNVLLENMEMIKFA